MRELAGFSKKSLSAGDGHRIKSDRVPLWNNDQP